MCCLLPNSYSLLKQEFTDSLSTVLALLLLSLIAVFWLLVTAMIILCSNRVSFSQNVFVLIIIWLSTIIAMTTEDVLDLSNTVLRWEPCKFYNLTQLQSMFPLSCAAAQLAQNPRAVLWFCRALHKHSQDKLNTCFQSEASPTFEIWAHTAFHSAHTKQALRGNVDFDAYVTKLVVYS